MSSLADIRGLLFDEVDADPAPSTDFVRRVNGFISRALTHLVKDVPFLFFEEEVRFKTGMTVESATSTDTLTAFKNDSGYDLPEVFQTDLAIGDANGTTWPYDRTWDTRNIELIDPTTGDVKHSTRIRAVVKYRDLDPDVTHIYLERPMDIQTHGTGPYKFRIYNNVHWLPDDIIEWRSGRLLSDNYLWELEVLGQAEAEDRWLVNTFENESSGPPRYLFRRGTQRIKAPAVAPLVEDGENTTVNIDRWSGPEPPGAFSYCYTLAWGKRSFDYMNHGIPSRVWEGEHPEIEGDVNWSGGTATYNEGHRNRMGEPVFESPPSPISATYTVGPMDDAASYAPAAKLTLPVVSQAYGYMNYVQGNAGESKRHTTGGIGHGWHYRIYRRRHSEDYAFYSSFGDGAKMAGTRYGSSTHDISRLEYDDGYYLLTEIPFIEFDFGRLYDNGIMRPDYSVRLPTHGSYQGVRFYPTPDAEYDVSVRVLRRPDELVSDTDAIPLPVDGFDLLIYKASTYYYNHLREPGLADRAEAKYEKELDSLRKRYGDLRPDHEVLYRRPARAAGFRSIGRRWWKRSTS